VAMYYYQTDIRNASLDNCNGAASTDFPSGNPDVCTDDVPETKLTQHMTTYTLGLGARGRMVYTSKDYMKDLSGDFYSVYDPKKLLGGIKADSTQTPPICSWQANGTICNWPIPASGSINNIDDLWHAAVDGNGTYYSARDPKELSDGLSSALTSITAKKGAAAAAATSTLNPVAGNNFAYVASYTTLKWIGNLEARTIDTVTGVISKNASWCAENIPADSCAAPGTVVTSINIIGNSTTYYCVTPNSTAAACLFPNKFDSVANTCSAQMTLACTGTLPAMIGPVASPNTDPCYNNANCDKRTIKTANSTGNLVNFYYGNLTAAQQAYFNAATISGLSQWTTLTGTQQTAAAGANLVNYLRGQKSYEDSTTNPASNRLFRSRETVLGDALESQPSFIAAPTFSYADAGYSAFAAAQASRIGMVYMGTNDGMLHAFYAQDKVPAIPPAVSTCVVGAVAGQYCGGEEAWAFVPSVVIPNLWHLADTDYGTNHVNFVNGSPIISDYYCTTSCPSGAPEWRTILLGGLNAGGREYYALDITNPTTPILLWEFTPTNDANLGYSFGLPVITKMADNTWVVLVTSGYDNGTLSGDGVTSNSPTGDGKGYLYVLNARTGAIIGTPIPTGVGTPTTPSGLSKFSVWNNATDSNLAGSTYGGDLLGNVWRFDINSSASSGTNPMLFAILKDASGVTQPVTTSPILGEVKGHRVVFVGTGKYLEKIIDNKSTQTQTLYAIMDDSATATLVNPRSYTTTPPKMVQQTISTNMVDPTTGITIRQGSFNPVSFGTDRGWFVDFPESGERVNIDGKLVLGTLLVPTIVPKSSFCSPGGHGWLNYFDYTNGWPTTNGTGVGPNGTNQNVSVHFDASIVGMNILFIGGKPVVEVVTSDNPTPEIPPITPVFNEGNSNFTGKRMQWRELIP
jgi:type IV pilus assembly protein PilY1